MKANAEIRKIIENSCFYTWQISQKLGIHENTFYRWMRTEMMAEKKEMVIQAISEMEGGGRNE
jgi:hypothetical protein